jgi:SSS family solute:Na+ symporter
MIARFMPIGLKGLVVTSLFAAFMSSIDTQLNLGTSYLINDFYRPYVSKNKSPRHYVLASRIVMILMTLAAILVATKLKSVFTAWKYIVVIVGGLGTVMIARWYWWRVNAYSEISAMVTCFFVANGAAILLPSTENADFFAVRLVITVTAVAAVWVLVTFLTSKQPDKTTIEFYTKMKIGGPGWKKVRQLTGIEPIAGEFKQSCVGWLSCTVFILGLMLSIGRFLFHQWLLGVVYLLISLIAGFVLKRVLSRIKF